MQTFNPINVSQSDLADNFEQALWHNEVPFFNGHGIAKFILSKKVREAGIKVVLTGEGADEIFAGYPHLQRDMILYNNENQNPQLIHELREKITSHESNANPESTMNVPMLNSVFATPFSWMQYQNNWMQVLSKAYKYQFLDKHNRQHPFN